MCACNMCALPSFDTLLGRCTSSGSRRAASSRPAPSRARLAAGSRAPSWPPSASPPSSCRWQALCSHAPSTEKMCDCGIKDTRSFPGSPRNFGRLPTRGAGKPRLPGVEPRLSGLEPVFLLLGVEPGGPPQNARLHPKIGLKSGVSALSLYLGSSARPERSQAPPRGALRLARGERLSSTDSRSSLLGRCRAPVAVAGELRKASKASKASPLFGLKKKASMVGFTLLSRSYYYLRRRSPGPPFLPDHRQALERGAINW